MTARGFAAMLCGALLSIPASAAPRDEIYVSNELSGDLSIIDAHSLTVVASVPLGKRPRGLKLSPDARTLYVALSGSPLGGPGVDESQLPAADKSADGIGVVDVATRTLQRVIRGVSDPEQLAVSADGATLAVASEDQGLAVFLDAKTGARLAEVAVGAEPEGVNLSRDGGAFFVTSEAGNAVTVLDARSFRALARIEAGLRPRSTAFSPDGSRAFVMNEASADITVIDVGKLRAVQTLPLPERSLLPMSGAVSPDSSTLFISTGRGGRVLAMNAANGEIRGDVAAGARPWGLALSADGARLYAANGPSDDVAVMDARQMQRIALVKVGKKPWGVACRPEFSPGK